MKPNFERYTTSDTFGREITYYLAGSKTDSGLPLIIFVQGSGDGSVFRRAKDPGDIEIAGVPLSDRLIEQTISKAAVALVEKPAVEYLQEPSKRETDRSRTYLYENTLDRRAEAINAAIKSAQALPFIDRSKLLVAGFSEGGVVAAKVAAQNRQVSHVASFAGGGPTQLFDMLEAARSGRLCGQSLPGTAASRVADVLAKWTEIQLAPAAMDQFWCGHSYRRWHSYIRESLLENLLLSSSKIFLVHGTEDDSSPVAGFDMVVATLLSKHRDLVFKRLEGASHDLALVDEDGRSVDLIDDLVKELFDWFLQS